MVNISFIIHIILGLVNFGAWASIGRDGEFWPYIFFFSTIHVIITHLLFLSTCSWL